VTSVFLVKARAFLVKDLVTEASYPLAFLGQLAGALLASLTLYFVARFIGPATLPPLERYGGDYFAFVLIGVALGGYLSVALGGFAAQVRQAQMEGTLEALLTTQTGIPMILFGSLLYSMLVTSIRVGIYLLVGALILGLNLGRANIGAALIILGLAVIAFSSVGILSASFIMVLKKGLPINWVFGSMSWLLAGVFYPVSVLPGWMQKAAVFVPLTPALDGMRFAVLRGSGLDELIPQLTALLIFAAVAVPLSALTFAWAVRRAKRDGSLTHY
jgi:ABC-2 type transport system permease protein